MQKINSFDFNKYDIGGLGALKGDGKLTGGELFKARKDGWTIWDGFSKNDTAGTVETAIDMLFKKERLSLSNRNNDTDKCPKANQDIMNWINGNYSTEDVIQVENKGDTVIIKKKESTVDEEGISTYYIKDYKDGTVGIITKTFDQQGFIDALLIDKDTGKIIVQVNDSNNYYNYYKKESSSLGNFVKRFSSFKITPGAEY